MDSAEALTRRRCLGLGLQLGLALAMPAVARAQAPQLPPELRGELPAARRQGQAVMRYFGLSIYDIRLWAAQPLSDAAALATPLALELVYARSLKGARIAERSLEEMRRQEAIDTATGERWLAQMSALFPDVRDGDRLTGLHRPGELVRFFYNGRVAGEVRDARFARLFFGIWLAPQTSEPGLRQQLLGESR